MPTRPVASSDTLLGRRVVEPERSAALLEARLVESGVIREMFVRRADRHDQIRPTHDRERVWRGEWTSNYRRQRCVEARVEVVRLAGTRFCLVCNDVYPWQETPLSPGVLARPRRGRTPRLLGRVGAYAG